MLQRCCEQVATKKHPKVVSHRSSHTDLIHFFTEIPSLLKLCKDAVIKGEIPFRDLIPESYEAMLEEHNSEMTGRLFRILVLSEEDRSK